MLTAVPGVGGWGLGDMIVRMVDALCNAGIVMCDAAVAPCGMIMSGVDCLCVPCRCGMLCAAAAGRVLL